MFVVANTRLFVVIMSILGVITIVALSVGVMLLVRGRSSVADLDSVTQSTASTSDTERNTETDSAVVGEDYASWETPPIFLSFITHSEEVGRYPNYSQDRAAYETAHANLINFATMMKRNNVRWQFQSDYNFLVAVQEFDTGSAATNGKNIIRWLEEDMGFDVDPHGHQRTYSYADIAYLLKDLGVEDTGVVGGFTAYPASDSDLEKFWEPIAGEQYSTNWQAKILWGGASAGHQDDDKVTASGVWRPKSADELFIDDPSRLPYIGPPSGTYAALDALLALQADGTLERGKIYTMSVMSDHLLMDDDYTSRYEAVLQTYADEIRDGKIVPMTLSEIYEVWQSVYDSVPNVFRHDSIEGTESEFSSAESTDSTDTKAKPTPSAESSSDLPAKKLKPGVTP